MSERIVRKKIQVSGRVQGVGFRYTASHAAQSLGLTGWVKNNWDGTVSMELQGEEELIARMRSALESGSWIRITDWEEENLPPDAEERGFSIRR